MKKWFVVLGSLVGVLLLTALVAGTVFAQGPVAEGDGVRDLDGEGYGQGRGYGYGFVDEDEDGINDRYGSTPEFVDEDGDGLCDLCGQAFGEGYEHQLGYARENGYGFVDEDGDGLNDRYGTNPEFVDEDGDGLCDIHGAAPGEGTAQGYSRWFRAEGETAQTPMAAPRAGRGSRAGRRAAAQ